ncbi:tripartite tricarboxylate transporter substrate binding protein [Variovorax sp. Sphag1AA]|uniref:Bug family tripartite tricarboxylate transporter substrate binding protein n=1 Tax=Variovorax sp. Sphag1AA TaxID=2587027 RepID=UPI00161757A0|nr:tripartite tricarboxylate transporter substrate-binding protein [Variovorax sp. Sphag1AA]MBB3182160.1 tripartite-type tricarboxylate transporter receptor subunit TctC [Variovorax sp. Sphag1AA]
MPNFARRTLLACGLSLIAVAGASHAQTLPPTIKLIVPYPPGGSVDTLARLIAQPLQEQLKTTVVVDNKPGAGGRISASQLKRSPADGSVILIAPNALTTIQSLVYAGQLDYKVMDDFIPLSRLTSFPISLAVPATSSFKTAPQLVAAMKGAKEANYGTSGAGGLAHFAGLEFGKATGIEWTHVAYKGGAPLITDLIGGHLPVAIDTLVDQIEHQRGGKIRVLGIFSDKRYSLAPDVPTLAEQGIKVPTAEGWFGAFLPAKTPAAVVTQLDQAMAKAIANPEVKEKLNKLVLQTAYLNSADFTRLQAAELQQWAPVVRDSGFKPD